MQPTEVQMGGMGDWDLFMSGRLGMIPTGIWAFSSFAEGCDFAWDIAVEPGADQKATAFFSNACVINAKSENPDGAAAVLDFMFTSDFVSKMSAEWPGYWGLPVTDFSTVDASMAPTANEAAMPKVCTKVEIKRSVSPATQ